MTAVELLVTRDKPPFAEVSGDKTTPPLRGTPPQRGTLFRNGMRVISHIRRKGELFRDGNVPSSPPLEGWRLAAGVVRDCDLLYLLTKRLILLKFSA